MDREQFDVLARLFASRQSRRSALAAFLGVTLLGHNLAAVIAKRGQHKHRSDRTKRDDGRKRQAQHRRKDNGRGRHIDAQASPPGSCFGSGACVPGPAAYLAKCDFTDSTALSGVNCSKSNLSDSSLLRAVATGANFTKANLSRVCFVDADLTGAIFSTTNLSGAIFCRTTMPNGSINNSGCVKSTKCCQTCIEVGQACGAEVGGSCCGEAECDGGVCVCPDPFVNCSGACKACCDDGDCDAPTPNCCNGTCKECCKNADCPAQECRTVTCTAPGTCSYAIVPDNQSGPLCNSPLVCCNGGCCDSGQVCNDDDDVSICCSPEPAVEACTDGSVALCGNVANTCGQLVDCGFCDAIVCQTGACNDAAHLCEYERNPDLTTCSTDTITSGVCCGGSCVDGNCCEDTDCQGAIQVCAANHTCMSCAAACPANCQSCIQVDGDVTQCGNGITTSGDVVCCSTAADCALSGEDFCVLSFIHQNGATDEITCGVSSPGVCASIIPCS